MHRDSVASRPRLTLVDGPAVQDRVDPAPSATPQVVLIPVERSAPGTICEFAFELARAIAAQTARTGAIVFADRSAVPRPRWSRPRKSALGPFTGMRIEPIRERESVLFFEAEDLAAVGGAVRGQMPQVLIAPDGRDFAGAWASVVVAPEGVRSEYVQLLRGDLEANSNRKVLVAHLPGAAGRRGNRSELRALAWELAAELVLES